MNALTIRPLDALARRINEQQYMIVQHSKSMLEAARIAGEALIEAKKQLPRGEFDAWVKANTKVSRANAYRYMDVAKNWSCLDSLNVETISDALVALGKADPRTKAPATNQPTFTEDDAEYALKIAARMGSEFEGEAAVAKAKLEKLAKDHGMTSGELVEKAKAIRPQTDLTDAERELTALREELARRDRILADLKARFAAATKDELIEILADLKARGLWKE